MKWNFGEAMFLAGFLMAVVGVFMYFASLNTGCVS